uniref:sensor histidine kinase n=1 Tax=Ningiella ruwaisensis TaxID=2364274 RepID=UPI0010A02FCE|nr:ATP-binding protein [Ningiella ruwaisensis]
MKLSISNRIVFIVMLLAVVAAAPVFFLPDWTLTKKLFICALIIVVFGLIARFLFSDLKEGLSALELGLLNLKDKQYSATLSYNKQDEIGDLCRLYNQTIDALRQEKRWLYQRELLLDKITQSSPEVLFLVNSRGQIVFGNLAAQRFFNFNERIEGHLLENILEVSSGAVRDAILQKKEGLFTYNNQADSETKHTYKDKPTDEGAMQTWHIAIGEFLLNNESHQLYILKQLTREISRQEVSVWKKVIRVISHELNNSLGPISSMLHSGRLIGVQLSDNRLVRVFATIDERIKHLSEFVQGYGKFAKIPEPNLQVINSQVLLAKLSQQWRFTYDTQQSYQILADETQLEQLLINLLKNAHESGSSPEHISIDIQTRASRQQTLISVTDKGKGMSETSLQNALIPFYSTKSNGSGLGLALCREIVDAHHGHISLSNIKGGGLQVRVILPAA